MHERQAGRPGLPPKNILVPTDFGPAADLALEHGRSLARAYSATLHIVHAVKDAAVIEAPAAAYARIEGDLEQHVRERLDALAVSGDPRVLVTTAVVRGSSPALGILKYAKSAGIDLIVIGTHGRHVISEFILGSVAQKVIRSAGCPVMTVRTPATPALLESAVS